MAAAPQVVPIGNGSYRVTVNGRTYTLNKQAPGSQVIIGGVRVTLPANPVVTPHLEAGQQLEFNQALDQINNGEIDLNAAFNQAHTNYERTLVDLAHNALVASQGVEENMAARGQYDSGLRDSALVDVESHTALAKTRAAQDLQSADSLYEAKHQGFNNSRTALQNWYNLTAGGNAQKTLADLGNIVPANFKTSGSPSPASTKFKPATAPTNPPGTPAPSVAPGATLPTLPPSATHVGIAVPATQTTYASGPPPGPNYKWNGYRWEYKPPAKKK